MADEWARPNAPGSAAGLTQELTCTSSKADELQLVHTIANSLPIMAKLKETHPLVSGLLEQEAEGTIKMLKRLGVIQEWAGQTEVVEFLAGETYDRSLNQRLKDQMHGSFMTQHGDARFHNISEMTVNSVIDNWANETVGQEDPWPPAGQSRWLDNPISTNFAEKQGDFELYVALEGTVSAYEALSPDGTTVSVQFTAKLKVKLLELDIDKLRSLEGDVTAKGFDETLRYLKALNLDTLPGFDAA